MKHVSYNLILIFCGLLVVTACQRAEKGDLNGPVALVPDAVYKFPQVLDGTKIAHDFIIHNKGNEILRVEKVKTT